VAYQDEFARAKRVATAKMLFYIHLAVYFMVNVLLLVINLTTSTTHLWFKWPLLGWGLGVLAHAVLTFVVPRGAGLRRWMIEREMRRSALKKP
jgi:hypothetical protein